MTLNELIAELQKMQEQHGDLPIACTFDGGHAFQGIGAVSVGSEDGRTGTQFGVLAVILHGDPYII